ncbi:MAG: hypothetical protein CMO26_14965 [Thiotrichales bacterium]|nr:hypothetical protein [Thiotrichales bacterium]
MFWKLNALTSGGGRTMILDDKLAAGDVIVLDGATGTEIQRLGVPMHGAAWCALANKTQPDAVRQVHESYIRAGANVITANTYATSRHMLESVGLADETRDINRRAVELALEARDNVESSQPVVVAGSISHMRARIPGGFERDPRFLPTPEREAENFNEMAEILAEAGCELLLMEMMFFTEPAIAATQAAMAAGLPVWVGLSCARANDGSLCGTAIHDCPGAPRGSIAIEDKLPLETLIDSLAALEPQVMGIMHSHVDNTGPGLETLYERWPGPVMAYPETADFVSLDSTPELTSTASEFAAHCRAWVEGGVQIIGGCCGTTIEHIEAMVAELPARPGRRPG